MGECSAISKQEISSARLGGWLGVAGGADENGLRGARQAWEMVADLAQLGRKSVDADALQRTLANGHLGTQGARKQIEPPLNHARTQNEPHQPFLLRRTIGSQLQLTSRSARLLCVCIQRQQFACILEIVATRPSRSFGAALWQPGRELANSPWIDASGFRGVCPPWQPSVIKTPRVFHVVNDHRVSFVPGRG